MTMSIRDEQVKDWLKRQKDVGDRMAREKMLALRQLTKEEALKIYLDLFHFMSYKSRIKPSPLLISMRRAVEKLRRRDICEDS